MGCTLQLVKALKGNDEDFEWYPTTSEIIDVINEDIEDNNHDTYVSVLDCGSGDDLVLNALTKGKKYAVELYQFCIKVNANAGKDYVQFLQYVFGKNIASIFCDNEKKHMKIKSTVSTRVYFNFIGR